MAAWTSADVIKVAPELDTTPAIDPAIFTYMINMAERRMDTTVFRDQVVDAGALLTAHLMIRLGYGKNGAGAGGAGASVGSVSSVTVGKVSVAFGSASSAMGGRVTDAQSAELGQTRQGLMFLAIVESLVLGPTLLSTDVPGVL